MSDPIVLEEGVTYKFKPPMMNQSALYQLSRYAYENDLRFGQALLSLMYLSLDDAEDLFNMSDAELERRIKAFINENNQTDKG